MSFVDGSDVIQSTLSCHDARECFIIMSGANGAKYVFSISVRIALRETQHWYVFTKCIFFAYGAKPIGLIFDINQIALVASLASASTQGRR